MATRGKTQLYSMTLGQSDDSCWVVRRFALHGDIGEVVGMAVLLPVALGDGWRVFLRTGLVATVFPSLEHAARWIYDHSA